MITPSSVNRFMPASEKEVRSFIKESWQRSLSFGLNPDLSPHANVQDDDINDYRESHPLAAVLPIIQQLLVRHTVGNGLIVAVGDEEGRLLWVDGDKDLRRKAETIAFVKGADWSERAVGTSAPGTALTLGRSIQIKQTEHFNRVVQPWSCTAVPVRDRATGKILGVIDITGKEEAVAPITLPLIEAAVAAVEAELDLRRANLTLKPINFEITKPRTEIPVLEIIGKDNGSLRIGQKSLNLSTRHTEILTILAWNPSGIHAQALAEKVYGTSSKVVTIRAEMVRLRKILSDFLPPLAPESRPYRLQNTLEIDAKQILALIDRGSHRAAESLNTAPVVPASIAPGIEKIRAEIHSSIREALMTSASVDAILDFARKPESTYDEELWRTCLQLLPARSPKRAAVVAHLERIAEEPF